MRSTSCPRRSPGFAAASSLPCASPPPPSCGPRRRPSLVFVPFPFPCAPHRTPTGAFPLPLWRTMVVFVLEPRPLLAAPPLPEVVLVVVGLLGLLVQHFLQGSIDAVFAVGVALLKDCGDPLRLRLAKDICSRGRCAQRWNLRSTLDPSQHARTFAALPDLKCSPRGDGDRQTQRGTRTSINAAMHVAL